MACNANAPAHSSVLISRSPCTRALTLVSFRLEIRGADDRPPFLGLYPVKGGKRIGRLLLARPALLPDLGEPRPHRRVGERAHDRRVEPGDDLLRRALRRP